MNNINDPVIKKAVKDFCDEMSASMSRAGGETDFQKEAIALLAEKHELDKKILKKMARTFHKSNYATQKQDQEDFELAYETLFGTPEVI